MISSFLCTSSEWFDEDEEAVESPYARAVTELARWSARRIKQDLANGNFRRRDMHVYNENMLDREVMWQSYVPARNPGYGDTIHVRVEVTGHLPDSDETRVSIQHDLYYLQAQERVVEMKVIAWVDTDEWRWNNEYRLY